MRDDTGAGQTEVFELNGRGGLAFQCEPRRKRRVPQEGSMRTCSRLGGEVEFTLDSAGVIRYACGMDMLSGRVIVK